MSARVNRARPSFPDRRVPEPTGMPPHAPSKRLPSRLWRPVTATGNAGFISRKLKFHRLNRKKPAKRRSHRGLALSTTTHDFARKPFSWPSNEVDIGLYISINAVSVFFRPQHCLSAYTAACTREVRGLGKLVSAERRAGVPAPAVENEEPRERVNVIACAHEDLLALLLLHRHVPLGPGRRRFF